MHIGRCAGLRRAVRPEPDYAYLTARPHRWRKQLAFKGRRLTVGQFLGRMRAECWTPEEAAADFDLPVEAAYEALEYGERHASLITAEEAEDAQAARDLTDAAAAERVCRRPKCTALPRVVEALYDVPNHEVTIRFENGARMAFPRHLLEGLGNASPDQLQEIAISGPGTGLYWPQLDVGHYVRGLMDGVFGSRRWMQALGRKGGATKTERAARPV
jgi:uncharacterized protein (DUF433 family)